MLQGKVYEAQRELVSNGLEVSAEKIRDFLLGREDSKKNLLEVYRYHVQQVKELLGKEYAQGMQKRFKAAFSSLEAYLKHKEKLMCC